MTRPRGRARQSRGACQPGNSGIRSSIPILMVHMRYVMGMAAVTLWLATTMAPAPAAEQQKGGAAGNQESSLVDMANAVIVTPSVLNVQERTAVRVLVEEVEKRTAVHLRVSAEWPAETQPAIAVGPLSSASTWAAPGLKGLPSAAPPGKEGYRLAVNAVGRRAPTVVVLGADSRGTLFGVGRLLRSLEMSRATLRVPAGLAMVSTPQVALRGHQLGYRPKTNTYDAWDVPMWEQYIRDLAIFGTNAIDLTPPRSDDDVDSPHFPLPPMDMMIEMSRLADEYGLDVWIWYPAMDKDYSDPKTIDFALKEWTQVFSKLPRIDVIFVPGGDPGHTQPKHLMALLEKQTDALHKYHPKAEMWVSPQSFNKEWLNEFFDIVKTEPKWLGGIVFGPQVRISLPELRKAIPEKYPIRHYPDITHTRQCQYPVPDWDVAFAITEGRECINPRPVDEAAIFKLLQPYTIGFLTYSEGCNDDVNKAFWSGLGWDPQQSSLAILREFARYFIGPEFEEGFAQGLLALERNWRGPLIANENVYTTLRQFQEMEHRAT